jgi:polar amino acid transport system substrate-binding protein
LTISLRDLFKRTNDPNLEFVYLDEQPKNAEGKAITSYGGIGFRKEDAPLRDLYSEGLKKLRASGRMLEIMKSFDFAEEDLPPADLTSEQVCAG